MCFEIVFEIRIVRGMARIDDRIIVARIIERFVFESCVICDIAKAAPVRDFWNRNRVTNEIDIINVFIEPSKIRNCSRLSLPVISEPMIAA